MFSQRELATILAALWYWREEMSVQSAAIQRPYFKSIGMPRAKPLVAAEIEKLAEKLRAMARQ
jgi:hypothetical protein